MIEIKEINSKKIESHKKRQNKISSKFPFDGNMDKVNWVKIRKVIDRATKILSIPKGFHLKTYKKGKMRFEMITPKKKKNDDIIIYFHGGGFVLGNAMLSRNYTTSVADITGSSVCSIDYPLAPNTKISECYDVIMSIYDLLSIKYPNSRFILSGTSAGGCLALGLAEKIIKDKKKLPSAIFLNSPLIDLTGTYKSINEIDDKIVDVKCKKAISKLFLDKYKKNGYLASPLLYVNKYLPKCMVVIDNNESLFTDSYVLYNKCLENEVECKLLICKNAYHAFQTLGKKTKETKEILQMVSEFIKD